MSAKFILLVVTTCLLVQSSFGRAVPEESSEKDITPKSTGNTSFSSKKNSSDEKYKFFLIRQSLHIARLILTMDVEDPDIEEGLKIVNDFQLDAQKYYNSLTIEEQVERKHLANALGHIKSTTDPTKKLIFILVFLDHPEFYSNYEVKEEENSSDEKYVILVTRQMLNFGQFVLTMEEEEPNLEERMAKIVNDFQQDAQKYYISLTIEEQAERKLLANILRQIESTNEPSTKFFFIVAFFDITFHRKNYSNYKVTIETETFAGQEFLNFLKITLKVIKGEVDQKKAVVKFVNNFIQNAEEYYKTLTIEGDKKLFADFLEELKNANEIKKQINVIVEWFASDDEEEEKDA